MTDFWMDDMTADIYEGKDLKENNKPGLRIYKTSTGWNLQIRTFEGINGSYGNRGKPRNMIANIGLDLTEIRKILAYIESTKTPVDERLAVAQAMVGDDK